MDEQFNAVGASAPDGTENREIDSREGEAHQPESGAGERETDRSVPFYQWRVHLAAGAPWWKIAVFIIALLGLLALTYAVFISWIPVAVFAVVLFVFFEDFIFPLRCEIGPEGVSTSGFLLYRRKIGWEKVRRCVANDRGVLCSPFEKSSLLDGTRGVFLRFTAGNREEVIANVRKFRDGARAKSAV